MAFDWTDDMKAAAFADSKKVVAQHNFIEHVRKSFHDRMFACQEAADDEMEANGETSLQFAHQEEADWNAYMLKQVEEFQAKQPGNRK